MINKRDQEVPVTKDIIKTLITNHLIKYTEISFEGNKMVKEEICTTYFLENNIWAMDFFKNINQFKEEIERNWTKYKYKKIIFDCKNKNIANELKFIVYKKIFSNEWKVISALGTNSQYFKKILCFLDEYYPNIESLLDIDIDKANLVWCDWLVNQGISLTRPHYETINLYGDYRSTKKTITTFFYNLLKYFQSITDSRDEFSKDVWDIRNLAIYGIEHNKTRSENSISFLKVNNLYFRTAIKMYLKERLLKKNISWGCIINYNKTLPRFFNYISDLHPDWKDLKDLNRNDILNYLEVLNIHAAKTSSNKEDYIIRDIQRVNKVLSDFQLLEYSLAPIKPVKQLILNVDKPKRRKQSLDSLKYIPDIVLEQLFKNINNLHQDIIPLIYVMYKTGLRISDALSLKHNCLIKLNGQFWIETDIEKTYVKGHRIPIDEELANILAVLIDNSLNISNEFNNPDSFIFVRYEGKRMGKPYGQGWCLTRLKLFAKKYEITDENGGLYHFKNHAFRHTYAVKMLNGGADILTVQELLAHASPEMTMRYAKLLDNTKRKTFDKAVKQGVFSFDESDKLKEENNGEIPTDILEMLYTNHKLNALDTPYGTCMQRKNGKCSFAKQPPCLTCNSGNPCKDLCVGAFEGDVNKYEILINSTKTMIENAKIYNRIEMINENEELLKLYEDIYSKISQGNLIYSRIDKLKRKGDGHE